MIIRVYALWQRSRKLLSFVLVFAVADVSFATWCLVSGKQSPSTPIPPWTRGCTTEISNNQSWHLGAAWGGVMLLDAMIFALTLHKTLKIGRIGGRTMADLLLRDGSAYFAIMSTATLCNVLTFFLGGPFTRGITTTYTNVLASVCSTRLMLNLRDPKLRLPSSTRTTSDTSRSSGYFVSTVLDIGHTSIEERVQRLEEENEIELVSRNERQPRIRFDV